MPVRLRDIIDVVLRELHVSDEELKKSGRERHVVEARAFIYLLARKHTRLSWRAIVKRSTEQNHMAAVRHYQRLVLKLEADPEAKRLVDELEQKVRHVQ
jgi:chromosomal replication initiation ATPase DnaA